MSRFAPVQAHGHLCYGYDPGRTQQREGAKQEESAVGGSCRRPFVRFIHVLQYLAPNHMIEIMRDQILSVFSRSPSLALPAGEMVFLTGQNVETIFMVRSGRVQLQRHSLHGARLILQDAGPETVLAEASAYSAQYHCDAVGIEAATLSTIPKARFLAALRDDPDLALAWSGMLASAVQAARVRSEIRSLPKVAERLDAWLNEGHVLPEKGRWQDVAAELGVTREALYRELARRR